MSPTLFRNQDCHFLHWKCSILLICRVNLNVQQIKMRMNMSQKVKNPLLQKMIWMLFEKIVCKFELCISLSGFGAGAMLRYNITLTDSPEASQFLRRRPEIRNTCLVWLVEILAA